MTAPQDAVDWSTPEVVRAINRLSTSMERFEESVETAFVGLDQKYVPRDVHTAALELLAARIKVLEDARVNGSTWLRDLVAPLVTGLTVGLFLFLLSHGLRA